WEQVLAVRFSDLVLTGKEKAARDELEKHLDEASHVSEPKGEVYLVGAGPGDPYLLTFRALRLMQQADVVVYDRLVSQPILDMVRRDAEFIYAGKARSDHAIPQEEINMLLARLAQQGKRVLRLKGGDPFIFGRGGEEIETLMEEGVAFQVVPGITAAAGCASYSGIPLTHRNYAQSVCFVTGHLKDGSTDLNWSMLSQPQQTVVFYMGLNGVKTICEQLIAHGRDPKTPAALVEKGTTPEHKVHIGDLTKLPEMAAGGEIKPPTLIIVGEVVELHEKLAWFEPSVSSN
ncbi:MAG: uroporphyrinogen-III C-methyltransferase, partial [Gammaproteobacteria bacterium]|nr:uroporphyrinogen-III C-methyltransferase [Gammaproteobacteria bacterium]